MPSTPKSSPFSPRNTRDFGFTLIELLTVIAIIGILAGIIIPVIGKVRSTAQAATCKSNFRQIGIGIIMYAQDNKDSLPVTQTGQFLTIGQGPSYPYPPSISEHHRHLATQLTPYIDTPTAKKNSSNTDATKMNWSPLFACPAWKNAHANNGNSSVRSLRLTKKATLVSTGKVTTSGSYGPWVAGTKLSDIYALAQTWTLVDIDQKVFSGDAIIPASAPHGKYRNTLYFDGHVGRTDSSLASTALDNLNDKTK